MKPLFIDTNIFIYAAGSSHPYKKPSESILEKIARNRVKAATSTEVFQEILYRYLAINERIRGLAIFDDCIKIVPIVLPVTKQDILKARQIIQEYTFIRTRDAVHMAIMLNRGIKTICSYDKDFDKINEIKRLEP